MNRPAELPREVRASVADAADADFRMTLSDWLVHIETTHTKAFNMGLALNLGQRNAAGRTNAWCDNYATASTPGMSPDSSCRAVPAPKLALWQAERNW